MQTAPVGFVALFVIGAACVAACSSSSSGPPRVPVDHRGTATACAPTIPNAEPTNPQPGSPDGCTTNEECTAGKDGQCANSPPLESTTCYYDTCTTDSDCATGICACASDGFGLKNGCAASDCKTDADCGNNYCSPTKDSCGNFGGYHCHTASDACVDDSDCSDAGNTYGPKCVFDGTAKAWQCQEASCPG